MATACVEAECVGDGHCEEGQQCEAGKCQERCPNGLTRCSSACVDTTKDPNHCGKCDASCSAGKICLKGACELSCPSGTEYCDGACVNVGQDAKHCGKCGQSCKADEVCFGGGCITPCRQGHSACSGVCKDLNTDDQNCGKCGSLCKAGAICREGKCACDAGRQDCESSCVDIQSDAKHCGGCNQPCAAGELCSQGKCAKSCAAGTEPCGASCVDKQSDSKNCGRCGEVCPSRQSCSRGKCACPTATPLLCKDACVDPKTNPVHCGGCSKLCGNQQGCVDGACKCHGDGLSACGVQCKDLTQDPMHCGGCNKACSAEQRCIGGSCRSSWAIQTQTLSPTRQKGLITQALVRNGSLWISGALVGSIKLGGSVTLSTGGFIWGVFGAKYSLSAQAAPKLLWARMLKGDSSIYPGGLAVDRSLNVYISGMPFGVAQPLDGQGKAVLSPTKKLGARDYVVGKLDDKGTWLRIFSGAGSLDDGLGRGANDDKGNVYFAGYQTQSSSKATPFLLSLDSAGTLSRKMIDSGGLAYAYGIAHKSGKQYLVGRYQKSLGASSLSTSGTTSAFLVIQSASGLSYIGPSTPAKSESNATRVAVDDQGKVYIAGVFKGKISFGSIALSASGGSDIFLAKYDGQKWEWALRAGGASDDGLGGLALDSKGNPYLAGTFSGSATFGSKVLTAKGATDVFLARLDARGNWAWARSAGDAKGAFLSVTDLSLDAQDNTYVAGSFNKTLSLGKSKLSATSIHDGFLLKNLP